MLRLWKFPHTVSGQLVTALVGAVMMIGPAGCTSLRFGVAGTTGEDLFGLLINTNTDSNVLGAVRLLTGEEVFVFGTFQENGNIGEVTAAVVRDQDGNESSLTLEDGRPKKATAADGSTIEFKYKDIETLRLSGSVTIFLASTGETYTHDFDIDLNQTAAELAQLIDDLTGLEVTDEELPPEPEARARLADDTTRDLGKESQQAQFIYFFFAPFFTFAFATVGYICMQVMAFVMQTVMMAVAAAMQAAMMAVFMPFFIMGNVLRMGATETIITIDLDSVESGVMIPPCPVCY